MKALILTSVICIFVTQTTASFDEESRLFIKSKDNAPECLRPGISCYDCWTSLNCIDLGNGTYYSELQHCPIGRTCKDQSGTCESGGNYECSSKEKLQCQSPGTFPSPFNCRDYFTCVQISNSTLIKYDNECKENYAFDPTFKICNRRMEIGENCSSTVSVCQNETHSGQVSGNANLYFRCIRDSVAIGFNYIPRMYGCPYNFLFNGTVCIDPTPPILDNDGRCIRSGLFSHTTDCRSYIDCTYIGDTPTIRTCSNEFQRFDPLTETCAYFSCNNCHA